MPLAQPTIHRHNGRIPGDVAIVGATPTTAGDGYAQDYVSAPNTVTLPVYRDDGTGNIYLETPTGPSNSGIADYVNNDSKYLQSNFDFWLTSHVSTAVLLEQYRSASASFANLLLSLTSSVTTFRARGAGDAGLVNTSAVNLALNTKYTARACIYTGTSGNADGKMRVQLTRKSDGVVLYDQENTAQSLNGVTTRIAQIGRLGNVSGGLNIDNVSTWDNAYELMPPLSDFAPSAIVSAGSDQSNVEPYDIIALSGTSTGGAPDSWTWTQTAGPAVTLTGSGANRSFVAPALANGATLTFSLTGTTGGTVSNADTVDVTVLPHNNFRASGGSWVGIRLNKLST